MKRLKVPGELKHVPTACSFVVDALKEAGMNDNFQYAYELVVDEICTNIIQHGYGNEGRDKTIELIIEKYADRFQLLILDDALAFDPLAHESAIAIAEEGIDGLQSGGWGIIFTKKMMNSVAYRYEQGRNCLVLEKLF